MINLLDHKAFVRKTRHDTHTPVNVLTEYIYMFKNPLHLKSNLKEGRVCWACASKTIVYPDKTRHLLMIPIKALKKKKGGGGGWQIYNP